MANTILVIDDEHLIREIAKDMLNALGHDVILAENGKEGLEIYIKNKDKIDLVLLDQVMPEMNGIECLHELRRVNPDVKVIFVTGVKKATFWKELKSLGVKVYLGKPYSIKKMEQAINKIII